MEPLAQDEYQMLSRMACDKIKKYIADNRLKAGDRLPTERDLAEQLEVSRPVIREALGILEGLGLIVKRQGKGIYLKDPNFTVLFQEMMGVWRQEEHSAEQLLQFRILMEQAAVESIIEQATETDYERLYALIAQSQQDPLSISEFIKLDYLFHRELLSLSGNPLLAQLTDVIHTYFHRVESDKLKDGSSPERQNTIRQHTDIVRFLQAKDKDGAAQLLKIHLIGKGDEQ